MKKKNLYPRKRIGDDIHYRIVAGLNDTLTKIKRDNYLLYL